MSLVIADSRPESLTLIAAQHEDWIIRQAITLLENRVFKAGPAHPARPGRGGGQVLRGRTGREELGRSEEHTSELQSLMRISYAVFCLKKKKQKIEHNHNASRKLSPNTIQQLE